MLSKNEIHEKLVEIVDRERVSGKDFEPHAYSRDLSPARPKLASFIVRPEKTEEIVEIVKIANKNKIPIYIRGCGCSHWAAWLPIKGGILLDMTSMDRIIEIDEENLTAVVESGCTWFKLMEELRKKKLTYLSSEMGGPAMTVGGNVNVVHTYSSLKVAELRIKEVQETGMNMLVTACPSCVQMLELASKRKRTGINVIDISELVLDAIKTT